MSVTDAEESNSYGLVSPELPLHVSVEVMKCSEGFKRSRSTLVGSKGHMPPSRNDCLIRNGEQVWSNGSQNNQGKSRLATTKSCQTNVSDFREVLKAALSGLKMLLSKGYGMWRKIVEYHFFLTSKINQVSHDVRFVSILNQQDRPNL